MKEQVFNKIQLITSKGEWKEIKDYPGYLINTEGDILNVVNGSFLTPSVNTGGYKFVRLKANGKSKQLLVHRLVAMTFIPNPENKPLVNHIDSDRQNSSRSNLEWVTHKENSEHMINTFRSPNQTMSILFDKNGDLISVFPSETRCLKYIYNQFRIEHGYKDYEEIKVDIELYTELSPVLKDGRAAKRYILTF